MPSISLPAAILGGAAISGVAGAVGSSAAAGAQQSAANTAAKTQMDIYNSNKGMLQPWNDQGFKAYGTLNDLIGIGGNSATMQSTLEGLPGYQFTRDQGLKSVQNSAAARGLGTSGAALKGAANYSTGLANSTWGSYADRLANSAGLGLGAGKAIAGVGSDTGANIGAAQIGAGNAAAAGYNGIASSIGNAAGALPLAAMLSNGSFGGGSGQTSGPLFGWT
jgi:hypothetical protein